MSLFNTMRTSVSGMAAQSNALSTIGDNIANSSTTGYKEANAQFETVIGDSAVSSYESGGVLTDIRYGVAQQGTLETTTSATDLAVNGNGFFVVSRGDSGQFLTRAGSFVPDSTGNLVNAAGYQLMGYKLASDGTPSTTLSVVNLNTSELQASPSTSGTLSANLPSAAAANSSGGTPGTAGTNPNNSQSYTAPSYSAETTMTVYDDLGQADTLDVYFTKTGSNTWEAAAYNHADASAGGTFPYAHNPLGTVNLTFDPTTGKLASGSPSTLKVNVPGGTSNLPIALTSTTQLAPGFSVSTSPTDGNAPSKLSSVAVGSDGTVTATYASGSQAALYRIPLATVQSPDNLTELNGNVYQTSANSGSLLLGTAGTGATGKIQSDALEQSTVDLATELTNMIQAQRGYEANSKVLQAASDMLSNLERLQVN